MFRSVNNTLGGSAMAVMMTGMGDDGTIAMKKNFLDNGAYTVAQNEESCVFWNAYESNSSGAVKDIVHFRSNY